MSPRDDTSPAPTPDADDAIRALLDASSLGQARARAVADLTPAPVVQRLAELSHEAAGARCESAPTASFEHSDSLYEAAASQADDNPFSIWDTTAAALPDPGYAPHRTDAWKAAEGQRPEEAPVHQEAEKVCIALWGGVGAGKTTFLAALTRALHDPDYGSWALYPQDHASDEYIKHLERPFFRDLRFPPATMTAHRPIGLTLAGDLHRTSFAKRRPRWLRHNSTSRFQANQVDVSLTIPDLPGESFDLQSTMGRHVGADLARDLADARGYVLLIDPVLELRADELGYDIPHNADYFCDMISAVATEIEMSGRRDQTWLPQRIAVCLSKFDDFDVFRFAHERGHVRLNPHTGMPEPLDSEHLFDDLARSLPGGGLADIKRMIHRYFRSDRVGYFTCSSVGFRRQPDGDVNVDDCFLVTSDDEGARLTGPPSPIGIMEPILFANGFTRRRRSTRLARKR